MYLGIICKKCFYIIGCPLDYLLHKTPLVLHISSVFESQNLRICENQKEPFKTGGTLQQLNFGLDWRWGRGCSCTAFHISQKQEVFQQLKAFQLYYKTHYTLGFPLKYSLHPNQSLHTLALQHRGKLKTFQTFKIRSQYKKQSMVLHSASSYQNTLCKIKAKKTLHMLQDYMYLHGSFFPRQVSHYTVPHFKQALQGC